MAEAHNSLFVTNTHGQMLIADQEMCCGTVYFVDSTATNAGDTIHHGQSREYPFATLAYAVTQLTANEGDYIVVGPQHAETVAAADDINFATGTADGVTVIGVIGHGGDRPVITFDGAVGADIEIDAHSVTIKNFHFLNTEDGALGPIDVNNAWFRMENCIFEDDGTDNTVDWILADAAATHMVIKDCINLGTDTDGNDSFVSITGAADHVRILGCKSNGDFDAGNIEMLAAATDIEISRCVLENADAVDVNIEGFGAWTGFVNKCTLRIATDGQGTWINTPGSSAAIQCFGNNAVDEVAMIVGTLSA